MANTTASLNQTKFVRTVQAFRNKMLVSMRFARTQLPVDVSNGDTIDFPTITDVRAQSYTASTDATIDDFVSASDTLLLDNREVVTFYIDPAEIKQATSQYESSLAFQAAHQLANRVDQTLINTGINGTANSLSGFTTPNSTNILNMFTEATSNLFRQNAGPGASFALIDPERFALIEQNVVANGFNLGDTTLKNGFVGQYSGYDVLVSNNLPSSQTLEMATIPTATDTTTFLGVTWTWVASGAAASAGEISIGANAAAAQANWLLAVNGTGTPGATTYIDVSVANRRVLQNAQASAAAWAGDESVLTAFGKINGAETFTDGTDQWGTETSNMLFGKVGAVSMAMQMAPSLFVRPEPKQVGDNHILHQLYGDNVFTRDADRLIKVPYNV
jgi:hypothetical protein|tara:strand:- start:308 stop:1474 length:1167 start_codon:yes stop_codon:yes gene_type:complete